MSSRTFSTALRHAKALNWRLNGTTQDIEWAKQAIEATIDQIPALAGKVDSAVINGDPHPNGDDPIHVSGVIGKRSLKGKNRVTSFHAYPNGMVKFSDKSLPTVQIDLTGSTTPGTGAVDGLVDKLHKTHIGSSTTAWSEWAWDANRNQWSRYRMSQGEYEYEWRDPEPSTSSTSKPKESKATAWSEWAWDANRNQWSRYRMSQGEYEYEWRDPEPSTSSTSKPEESKATAWSEWAWDANRNQWGRYRMSQGEYEYEWRDPEPSGKSKGKRK